MHQPSTEPSVKRLRTEEEEAKDKIVPMDVEPDKEQQQPVDFDTFVGYSSVY